MRLKQNRMGRIASGISYLSLAILLTGCASLQPQPIKPAEQKAIAAIDRQSAQADVEPLNAKLTLAEAIARGLKYNLDHRTRMMEQALAIGQLDLSHYDLLPKILVDAGYDSRNNERITRSKDSVTGLPSLANPYISSDRSHSTEGLGLAWNALDFGVSYFNAKQNADRVLVAAEHRRKAMHNLIRDVRTAYWRALSAQQLASQLTETITLAESALQDARNIESEKVRDPLDALRYQRTVLENLRILESIQRELSAAHIELAALINLPPGANFELQEPLETELTPAKRELSIERMEETAIANNAEFKEHFYNARIVVAETKKSLLRMFPNLSFNYGVKHDSDSYLIHNNWSEAGAQLSWNLLNLLSLPTVKRFNAANEKLAEERRIAAQMALLAQVHLSRQQYDSAYLMFRRADEIWQVDQRIYQHISNREQAQIKGHLDRVSDNTSAIVSLLRRYQALSEVYAALSKVEATLGVEPAIGDLQSIKLDELKGIIEKALHDNWGAMETGETVKEQSAGT